MHLPDAAQVFALSEPDVAYAAAGRTAAVLLTICDAAGDRVSRCSRRCIRRQAHAGGAAGRRSGRSTARADAASGLRRITLAAAAGATCARGAGAAATPPLAAWQGWRVWRGAWAD